MLSLILATFLAQAPTDLDRAVKCADLLATCTARRRYAESALVEGGFLKVATSTAIGPLAYVWQPPAPPAPQPKARAPSILGVALGGVIGAGVGGLVGPAVADEKHVGGASGAVIGALVGMGVGLLIDAF